MYIEKYVPQLYINVIGHSRIIDRKTRIKDNRIYTANGVFNDIAGIIDDSNSVALSNAIIISKPRAAANSFSITVNIRWMNASKPSERFRAENIVTIKWPTIIKNDPTKIEVQQKEKMLESRDILPNLAETSIKYLLNDRISSII